MKILIAGGAGFVGSNLAFYFAQKGYKITVIDNLTRRGTENNLYLFKKMNIEFIHGDIRNKEDFTSLPSPDVILNCAAQPSAINYSNPLLDITSNFIGALNVLQFCAERKSSLIFWSTNKCYSGSVCNSVPVRISNKRFVWDEHFKLDGWNRECGFNENLPINGKDHSPYGLSKVCADLLHQEWADAFQIPVIINRFSCLYGPNQWGKAEQGWMTWFAIANYFSMPIQIHGFGGNQVRDFLFIDDMNELISKQIDKMNSHKYLGEVFNVGGGKNYNTSINEVIEFVAINYRPWSKIEINEQKRRADQKLYISDITKVSKEFNWSPCVDLKIGFKNIFEWIHNNEKNIGKIYE